MEMKWYVIHTATGFENKAKLALEERIKAYGMEERFGEILIPQEQVVELVKGKRRSTSRKFFPGYILVQMALADETWHLVRNTPKVTGFVGGRTDPPSIPDDEVRRRMLADRKRQPFAGVHVFPDGPGDLLGISPEERFLLERLRGPMAVRQLLSEAHGSSLETLTRLVQLHSVKLIRPAPAAATPRSGGFDGRELDGILVERLSERIRAQLEEHPIELGEAEHRKVLGDLLARFGGLDHYELLGERQIVILEEHHALADLRIR